MTTTDGSTQRTNWLAKAMNWHRPLMLFASLMVITTLVSAAGLLIDDRVLTGAPIWLKPFKFSVSFVLYAVTWAWMFSLQRRPRRWLRVTGTVVAALGALEMVIIIGQVLRGKMSHFNAETDLDSELFGVMGTAIAVVWVLNLVQAIVLLRERATEAPITWALRFGAGLSLVGMAVAILMTGPKPEQLDALQAGASVPAIGGHSVGVPDGGPGMPITGWSTEAGDLRVPHFFGIHALQALPLLAFGLLVASRRWPRLRAEGVRTRLVLVGSVVYAGLLGVTIWQALRGQSLIAPDALTLGVAGLIVAAGVLGTIAALARPAPTLEHTS
jgi:hypothetical protein